MYNEEGTANNAPINKNTGFLLMRPITDITSELIEKVQNIIPGIEITITPPPERYVQPLQEPY